MIDVTGLIQPFLDSDSSEISNAVEDFIVFVLFQFIHLVVHFLSLPTDRIH